ncbi:hypothetical protein PVAP13_6KG180870 [Panicum virgatum]|uniref:Uncharacterized protein n=1 Tax=Panicum virgatum TaxID=38727 RepID=A0A8T0RAW1_PANVG|nr:hypothetical protein PVAP13_6KG180870 [Panicum virgatum]
MLPSLHPLPRSLHLLLRASALCAGRAPVRFMDGEAVEQGASGGVDAPAGHGRGRGVSAAATAPGSKVAC